LLRFARNDTPMAQSAIFQTRSQHCLRKGREASAFRGATFVRRCLAEAASVGVVTPGAITGASGSRYSGGGATFPPFHPATREGISAVSGCRPQHRRLSGSQGLLTCLRHCLWISSTRIISQPPHGVNSVVSGEVHGSFAPLGQVCVRALLAK